MDKFQYVILKQQWATLTTKKSKEKFIRDAFHLLEEFVEYDQSGQPCRTIPEKESALNLRLLRNCFRTYNPDQLPDYIPATVFALIRN